MKSGLIRTFKTTLDLKIFVIRKLFKSDNFIFLDFKKIDKENGYAEGYFTANFTDKQRKGMMSIAQQIHVDNMKHDNMKDVINEANSLIKS